MPSKIIKLVLYELILFSIGSCNLHYYLNKNENKNSKIKENKSNATTLYRAIYEENLELVHEFIAKDTNVNISDKHGRTPLHFAASLRGLYASDCAVVNNSHSNSSKKKLKIISLLLKKGADINTQNKTGETPLHIASLSGALKIVTLLLEKGANPNAKNQYNETPLHSATSAFRCMNSKKEVNFSTPYLWEKKLKIIALLVKNGANINAIREMSRTPLMNALNYGVLEIVSFLIEKGANVNAKNKKAGQFLLHKAVSNHDYKKSWQSKIEIVRLLIEKGVNVNDRGKWTPSAFEHVVLNSSMPLKKKLRIASILIKNGANINVVPISSIYSLGYFHKVLIKGDFEVASFLINNGIDVNLQYRNGSPLDIITRYGRISEKKRIKIISFLIKTGLDINTRGFLDRTHLQNALNNGSWELASFLIKKGADIYAEGRMGSNYFSNAIARKNWKTTSFLIKNGFDINAKNNRGESILHSALRIGRWEVALFSIKNGADVNMKNGKNEYPLYLVMNRLNYLSSRRNKINKKNLKKATEVISLLIRKATDINSKGNSGRDYFKIALKQKRWNIASLLIESGYDINAKNKNGNTFLHIYSSQRKLHNISFLLKKGADINAQNKNGQTPLHIASSIRSIDMVSIFIEKGADVNIQDKNGQTPLHIHVASSRGNIEMASLFIEKGTDINAQDKNGQTPLHIHVASSRGNMNMASLFIKKGADINAQDENGQTPLHIASSKGKIDMVSLFIEKGANTKLKNKNGQVPFIIAKNVKQENINIETKDSSIKNKMLIGLLKTSIQPGAIGPGWRPYNKEREERLAHRVEIYNSAKEKRYLMKCDADSYFRLTNCLYKNKEIEKKLKAIKGWGVFSTRVTGYEYKEIFSYEHTKNRHKVLVTINHQEQYLWLSAEPPLNFSNYIERVAQEADGFTEYWDRRLFLSPQSNKYIPVSLSGSIDNYSFTIIKDLKINGNIWLQIRRVQDFAASCRGKGNYLLPYENLWLPLFNKENKYNATAFSRTKGC